MVVEGWMVPFSSAAATVTGLITEPGSYWVVSAALLVPTTTSPVSGSVTTLAIASTSPVPGLVTMAMPPLASVARTWLARAVSASYWISRSRVSVRVWPGTAGTRLWSPTAMVSPWGFFSRVSLPGVPVSIWSYSDSRPEVPLLSTSTAPSSDRAEVPAGR